MLGLTFRTSVTPVYNKKSNDSEKIPEISIKKSSIVFNMKHEFYSAEMCFLSNNIYDYYNVSQGKITIPGIDDKEEMDLTDVSPVPLWINTFFFFIYTPYTSKSTTQVLQFKPLNKEEFTLIFFSFKSTNGYNTPCILIIPSLVVWWFLFLLFFTLESQNCKHIHRLFYSLDFSWLIIVSKSQLKLLATILISTPIQKFFINLLQWPISWNPKVLPFFRKIFIVKIFPKFGFTVL